MNHLLDIAKTILSILDATNSTQAEFAKSIGVNQGSVSRWISGQQFPNKRQWDEVERVYGTDPRTSHFINQTKSVIVAVMGRVGAGAVVEPLYEQVPEDGLFQVELPFPLPGDMIGFEVEGDSMLPRYDPGDIIVVYKDQRRSTDAYLGNEAVVNLVDGRRALKYLRRGSRPGTHTLESFNARPVEDVEITWVGEIYLVLRSGQWRVRSG